MIAKLSLVGFSLAGFIYVNYKLQNNNLYFRDKLFIKKI